MAAEFTTYLDSITESFDRIVKCFDGLTADELNWKPIPEANGIYVLANHTLESVKFHILVLLCGQPSTRNRDAELAVHAGSVKDGEALQARWQALQLEIANALGNAPTDLLDQPVNDPNRGPSTGRGILIKMVRHSAEHCGHAELTRDLLRARK